MGDAAIFPKNFALRNRDNDKYLRFVHEAGQLQGYLHFSGDEVTSPYCRFESELSVSAPQMLVNIRCVFNNRYLVCLPSTGYSAVPLLEKPNEDWSVNECTTIRPIRQTFPDRPNDFGLIHTRGGSFLWPRNETWDFRHLTLYQYPGSGAMSYYFEVVDLDLLVTFPAHIAFKGDIDLYLAGRIINRNEFMQFAESDSAAPSAAHEVLTTRHGQIRVRNREWGKFWRRSPNWIWADSTDNTANNPDTLFSAIQLEDDVVALRNLGNNNFCRRFTAEGNTNCYNAADGPIMVYTRVKVTELVVARRVFNVIYHLSNSRIYGEQALMMGSATVENPHNIESSLGVSFSHASTTETTWTVGMSLMTGVSSEITAGIPLVAGASITVSAEITQNMELGRTLTQENTMETNYTVENVPPRTRAIVRMMATRATCDVPFSYTQIDILTNGVPVTKTLHNGIYKGVSNISVYYEVDLIPL